MPVLHDDGLKATTKSADRDAGTVLALALFPITLFAFTPVAIRILVGEFDPLMAGLARTAGAIVVTLPLALALRFRLPRDRQGWILLVLNAALTFTAFPVLFALGAEHTSASHAALIMAATPIVTGISAAVVERHAPRHAWWLGSALAFAGEAALILARGTGAATSGRLMGDLLILAAVFGAGTGYVAGARLGGRIGVWPATFWAINLAGLVQLPFIALRWPHAHWHSLDAAGWAALLHLTFGVTVIALVSWLWALERGGIARVAVLQFAQPVIAVGLAAVLLHEPITPALLLAATPIVAGVVIARRR
ncbi:MAG TPA: DMT family transporter [Stellaceae bacterium]|nr:DMT family transporter [Stellaceae bacterium]